MCTRGFRFQVVLYSVFGNCHSLPMFIMYFLSSVMFLFVFCFVLFLFCFVLLFVVVSF